MPLIDMPLKELKKFKGLNERPSDIDEYWDRAVSEMEALGTGFELIPSSFHPSNADCFDLYFIGIGGARIHSQLILPKKIEGNIPAVVMFHGYTGDCGSFSSKLNYTNEGFVVAALDCRGQGGKSEDIIPVKGNTFHGQIIRGLDDPDPDKLYFRNVFLDCAQLVRIVMSLPYVDGTRVGITGGSQGGGLTLACAALTPDLNRAAPLFPFLCDYRRVWEMDLAVAAYAELKDYFRHFDPRHERESEIFTKLGYIDNQHIAHRTKCKVKMFTGLMDNICPPSSQFAAYNKITSEKEVVIYPDFGHEGLPDSDDMIMSYMLEMKA